MNEPAKKRFLFSCEKTINGRWRERESERKREREEREREKGERKCAPGEAARVQCHGRAVKAVVSHEVRLVTCSEKKVRKRREQQKNVEKTEDCQIFRCR